MDENPCFETLVHRNLVDCRIPKVRFDVGLSGDLVYFTGFSFCRNFWIVDLARLFWFLTRWLLYRFIMFELIVYSYYKRDRGIEEF